MAWRISTMLAIICLAVFWPTTASATWIRVGGGGGSGASAPLLTEAIGYVHYGPKTAFINGSAVWLSGKDLCGT